MIETRYLNIANHLKSRIIKGDWQKKLPGISLLSQQYDVNPRTISKAIKTLSNEGVVTIRGTQGTYITQYTPRRRYNVIGVLGLAHEKARSYELSCIEEVAQTKGYHVLGIEHQLSMLQNGLKILKELPIDGLIFSNSILTAEVASELREAAIPFVSVNRITTVGGVNWVDFDSQHGYSLLYNDLLAKGHRRIAYVSFKANSVEYAERMQKLYQTTMTAAKCYDSALYNMSENQNEYYKRFGDNYYEVLGAKKAGALLNMDSPPTAVITGSIEIAKGFCRYADQIGLKIPKDLSVVAVSQNPLKTEQEDFLSILACPAHDRAQRVAQILLELIDDPSRKISQELLPMKLIERKSVAARV